MKTYKLRRVGSGKTIQITVPYNVLEREMRRMGVDPSIAEETVNGVWRFNSFNGLHLSFEPKEKD